MAYQEHRSQNVRQLRENLLPHFLRLDQLEEEPEASEEEEQPPSLTVEAETILRDAHQAKATDIHVDPCEDSYRIRLRVDGIMLDACELSRAQGNRIINQFKTLARLNPLPSFTCEESSFLYEEGDVSLDLRITAVPCSFGSKIAIRILEPSLAITQLEDIGIFNEGASWMRSWLDANAGMLLVAGPTGSGKTTTLYTLLHQLKMSDTHVVTLEKPVEYQISGINQIQIDPENGIDFETGSQALLRLDPDYVLIGELRSPASAEAALNVASSGRALMGTLHSKDAVGTVSSLRNLGMDDFEIAANLNLVVAQRLVRRLCPECRKQTVLSEQQVNWLKACGVQLPEEIWEPVGCDNCKGIGYKDRIGIFEVWCPIEEDRSMIMNHEDEYALRRHVANRGNPMMIEDGMDKVRRGITTVEELIRVGAMGPAMNVSTGKEKFEQQLLQQH